MSLSECQWCGGHIPLGPRASNCCVDCGKHVMTAPPEPAQPTEADRLLREVVEAGEHLPAFLRSEKYAIPLSKAIDRARAYLEGKA